MSSGPLPLPDPADGMELSPVRVQELLPAIAREEITLLDCREEEEWRYNRLPGARWAPLSRFAEQTPPAGPVIVYCHHGMRSLRAAEWLRARGCHAWSMSGGIEEWSLAIDPAVPRY